MLPRGEKARISSPTRSAWLERAGSPLTRTWFASQAVWASVRDLNKRAANKKRSSRTDSLKRSPAPRH